jgi:hypothetical protein
LTKNLDTAARADEDGISGVESAISKDVEAEISAL